MLTGKKFSYNDDATIINYIEQQVNASSSKQAIIDGEKTLSYQQLSNSISHVARQLHNFGIKKNTRVSLLVDPSDKLIILILAILKLGACYLPIDKNYPEKRIKFILNDSQSNILISDNSYVYNNSDIINISVNNINFYADGQSAIVEFENELKGETPAYIIYTSGSTGNPKGIIIPHRAVNNHMLWMANEFNLTGEDIFLLKTPLSFDPSIWEIFLPLFLGATLVIAKKGTHSNPKEIINYVRQYAITVVQFVPVILHQFILIDNSQAMNSLRYVFVGGENLSTKTKKMFFDKIKSCRLINLYGPAEATIDVTFHEILNCSNDINKNYIGTPINNVELFILNESDEKCQVEEIGELYIAGDCLALGYVHKDLDHNKFVIKNLKNIGVNQETLMYRTGDLVKIDEHKILIYCGRRDHQIKLNGVRIEIDELRKCLLSFDTIYECKFAIEVNEKYNLQSLVCYLVPEDNHIINLAAAKMMMQEQFPDYMLPKKYYISEKANLSPNGKLEITDKENLPIDNDEIERVLFNLWSSILNTVIDNNKVNFFDLGGDSISFYVLLAEINKNFSMDANLDRLIECTTIEKQKHYIKNYSQRKSLTVIKTKEVSITTLNSKSENKIFLVHPIGGTIFWFIPLAHLLDGFIQVHAIQDPGIVYREQIFNSIEEMANAYSEKILSQFPADSYILGGASFGGTVAVEIAKHLELKGRSIDSIEIFDGWALYPNELKDEKYFRTAMLCQQQDWINKFNQVNYDTRFFEDIFNIQMHRLNLLFQYQMLSFDFHVNLFKAEKTLPIFKKWENLYNYWNQYTKRLNVYNVPGDHESMFLQSNAQTMAKLLISNILRMNLAV